MIRSSDTVKRKNTASTDSRKKLMTYVKIVNTFSATSIC